MFGLMRPSECGSSAEAKEFRRLNYCGTCKTIGAIYGQKARLFLNHDIVFLAEILTVLGGDLLQNKDAAYISRNCFSFPKAEMPLALVFAANANVTLAEFKIRDKALDERSFIATAAKKLYKNEFETANDKLEQSGFPAEIVRKILSEQEIIESTVNSLDDFSRPTAEVTGIFFREGVKAVGRAEIADIAYEAGALFGKLIYLIDAFEDFAKDAKRNEFNAFAAAFGQCKGKMSDDLTKRAINEITVVKESFLKKISDLTLSDEYIKLFSARINTNVNKKLGIKICRARSCETQRIDWKQHFENAVLKARALTVNYSWQMPFAFLLVFVFTVLAPAQTKDVKTVRECAGLGVNLMFLSSLLIGFPLAILSRKRKERTGCCDSWCGDCGGDCCCDGCDCCCECDSCDGCDCCSCDCN